MRQQNVEKYLARYYWLDTSTITASQSLLGASALTHAAVLALSDTKKAIIEIPQGWIAFEMRFFSDSAANTTDVLQMYAEAGADNYRHFGQLTLTVGTQVYGDYTFHDTVVPAGIQWMTRSEAINPANNTFGSFVMNTHAHSRVLLIASTLGSTTLGAEYRKV